MHGGDPTPFEHVRLSRGLPCSGGRRAGLPVRDDRVLRASAGMTRRPPGDAVWRRRQRLRRSIAIVVCAIGVVVAVLVARRITTTSWPLEGARIELALAAGAAYLRAVFRALGWQQLFPPTSRPDRSRCLAACGAAAASGVVLPFRLDYVVKVDATPPRRRDGRPGGDRPLHPHARSCRRRRDAAACSRGPRHVGCDLPRTLAVVLLFCLGCIGVLTLGPKLARLPLVARSSRLEGSATASAGAPPTRERPSRRAAFSSAAGRRGPSAQPCC